MYGSTSSGPGTMEHSNTSQGYINDTIADEVQPLLQRRVNQKREGKCTLVS